MRETPETIGEEYLYRWSPHCRSSASSRSTTNDPGAISATRKRSGRRGRAAVLAYRRELRATREDRLAWPAAYKAFREVLPEMPQEQAKLETTHAIAYAAANHTRWFWKGVYGEEA